MSSDTITKTLSWLGQKILAGILSFLNTTAFPVAVLVVVIGCILVITGFRKKGFKIISLSFIIYLLIQIVLIALELVPEYY